MSGRRQIIILYVLGLTLMATRLFAQSPWKWGNRVQVGLERDSNIFESSRFRTAAAAGRFVLRSRLDRAWPKLTFSGSYAGGLQAYPEYAREHKITNQLDLGLRWRLAPRWQLSGRAAGFLKLYFEAPLDFAHTLTEAQLDAILNRRFSASLSLRSFGLDYAASDVFDFSGRNVALVVHTKVLGRAVADFGARLGHLKFRRPAYAVSPDGFFVVQASRQEDQLFGASLRLSWRKGGLWQLIADWQQNASNSYGNSYSQFRISTVAGWRPARRVLLRLAALLQFKHYTDTLPPALPIELDAERNESNFLVADISLDATRHFAWLLRLAFYDNESSIRNVYYRKLLFFAGAEYRF